jgi:hypothetical protein
MATAKRQRHSQGLATSGMRWGVSCEVENEAQMGVILGYMKLFGGTAIGFENLGRSDDAKDPARVRAGKLGGRRKGSRSHERGTLLVAARKVIAGLPEIWHKRDFAKKLGWSKSATSRALALLVASKEISRAKGVGAKGRYRTHPKIVRAAS